MQPYSHVPAKVIAAAISAAASHISNMVMATHNSCHRRCCLALLLQRPLPPPWRHTGAHGFPTACILRHTQAHMAAAHSAAAMKSHHTTMALTAAAHGAAATPSRSTSATQQLPMALRPPAAQHNIPAHARPWRHSPSLHGRPRQWASHPRPAAPAMTLARGMHKKMRAWSLYFPMATGQHHPPLDHSPVVRHHPPLDLSNPHHHSCITRPSLILQSTITHPPLDHHLSSARPLPSLSSITHPPSTITHPPLDYHSSSPRPSLILRSTFIITPSFSRLSRIPHATITHPPLDHHSSSPQPSLLRRSITTPPGRHSPIILATLTHPPPLDCYSSSA